MNVFQMYYCNGKEVGFWIKRNSWGNTVAKVISIDDQTTGSLKSFGSYPYFNKAKEKVYAEIYKIVEITDNIITLHQTKPEFFISSQDPNLGYISCPGTFGYDLLNFEGKTLKIKKLNSQKIETIQIPYQRYFLNLTNQKKN